MKKIFAIIIATLLLLCFVGCGAESSAETTPTEYTPATIINPRTIDLVSDSSNPDRWYMQGTDDIIYIYFAKNEDNTYTYNLVKSGVVKESAICTVTDDNHITPIDGSTCSFDLVFENCCDVYDYTSGKTYSRGDKDIIISQLAGYEFIEENDSKNIITLNDDYTCTKTDISSAGSWELVSPSRLKITFEETDSSQNTTTDIAICNISYNDDKTVRSIYYKDELFYREYPEDETINKYLS